MPSKEIIEKQEVCVCCPCPVILDCADTDEHKHPGCTWVGPIANTIVKEICLGDFQRCPRKPGRNE